MKTDETDPFAASTQSKQMEVNGFKVTLNMPKAVKRTNKDDGSEVVMGLPPYNPRPAFAVDEYPACPDSWMHGSGKASSYFVPILGEHGMWLDLTANQYGTHHVAAVISVQGVNPLTTMKVDPARLEQYRAKCPKHDVDFQQDLYCPSCKYKWHPQNYLCSNNGSPFWIDGFRTEEGVIRQWYFTEEECKGVAAQVLGAERVFSIGVAFYRSKQPKPIPQYAARAYTGGYLMSCSAGGGIGSVSNVVPCSTTDYVGNIKQSGVTVSSFSKGFHERKLTSRGPSGSSLKSRSLRATPEVAEAKAETERNLKQLEIGAGAKIHQKVNADPEKLDFWEEEPAGMIYINYCDVETAQRILAAGKREEVAEGPLNGLNLKA